jgi:hypothetical protein
MRDHVTSSPETPTRGSLAVRHPYAIRGLVLAAALVVGLPAAALSQATTGSLQGVVRDSVGQPLAASEIVARHLATNFERSTSTTERGFYRLSGLRAGDYEVTVRNAFFHDETRSVSLGVGQTINLDFALTSEAVEIEGLVVTGERTNWEETVTTEVATNITTEQIEELPQSDRNFLNFSTLVPGVRREGGSITSGAARDENINVFIDGASYKNDILQGGVAGQDASDGNPFPQNAIDGFRVITQQYKAEYQKATSAIITATTKTGTNTWQADAFGSFTNQDLAAQELFSAERGDDKPEFDRWQAGASLGGPIIQDELFIFGSYEGNIQDRLTTVNIDASTPPVALNDFADAPGVEVPADLSTLSGTFPVPFRSHLFFGKLTWQPESRHTLDLSVNIRDETREGGFGGTSSAQQQEVFDNNVNAVILKHQWDAGDDLLNEVIVNYLEYAFHPEPLGDGVTLQWNGWGAIGPRCCAQDLRQKRFGIRDDLTWTVPELGGLHVFKAGASVDFNTYTSIKELQQNPTFIFHDLSSPFPDEAFFEIGDPRVEVDNSAIGLYVQDDWSPSDRLTLNLGIRWDVETGVKNNDFVTPDSVRDALSPLVDAEFEERFFTDGDRDPFMGAFQPRVGATYTLREIEGDRTVLFGGAGLYYDRTPNEWMTPEFFRLQRRRMNFFFSDDGMETEGGNPTIVWQDEFLSREGLQGLVDSGQAPDPEVFLLDNDLKPPKAFQGSFGVRQTIDDYLFSASYTAVRGYDDMVFWFYHNCPNEATTQAACNPIDPPNFTNILVTSQDESRHWFDGIYVKAQKRFTEESRWGAQIAYTLGWAKEQPNLAGQFGGLCCLSPATFHETPSRNDERHRVAVNWIVGLPWDIRFSGIGEFGTGLPYDIVDPTQTRPSGLGPLFCTDESTAGNCVPGTEREGRPTEGGIFPDRRIDVRLQKGFEVSPGYRLTLQAEVFDLFDWDVFTGYGNNVNNENFREALNTNGDTRRFQLGARVEFDGL